MIGVNKMNRFDQLIEKEKKAINELHAPKELEVRLQKALFTNKQRSTKINWIMLAATLVLVFTIGSQYEVVAYYGKKLIGYEELTNETLFDLNEKEFTQIINKTYTFNDGKTFTIDGIMTDENQSIIYFHHSNVGSEEISVGELNGFLTRPDGYHGSSITDENTDEVRGVFHYQPINPFTKKLTLPVRYKDKEYVFEFDYRANQALATRLKKSLNQTVELGASRVTFKHLIATPTMTMIHGTINKYQDLHHEDVYLLVNGKEYEMQTGSETSGLFKDTFTIGFDALPEKIESLQLYIGEYLTYTTVEDIFRLGSNIDLGEEQIEINDVKRVDEQMVGITMTTKEDVVLKGVNAIFDDGEYELLKTIDYEEKVINNEKHMTRTMVFEMNELPTKLSIQGFHSMIDYEIIKDIKIN